MNDLLSLVKDYNKLLVDYQSNPDIVEHIEEVYYEYAMCLFDLQHYQESILYLIKAYEMDYKKNDIIEFLNNAFISPNEHEFKLTYESNKSKFNVQIPYEDLQLNFIYVDEDKYYIYDTINECFYGLIDCRESRNLSYEAEIEGILYADIWDVRVVIEKFIKRSCYILPNDYGLFISFLKIPNLVERYLQNSIIFKEEKELVQYFHQNNSIYLPKTIIGKNTEKYREILKKEHEFRLTNQGRSDSNILLSICIPSYNRGNSVLESVKTFLNGNYDAEVEIIVSDDASSKFVDEYKKLEMIKDSRLTYVRRETNLGFKLNMLSTYKMAKGKFAVLCSDEDSIILSSLPYYLNLLKDNPNVSLVASNSLGPNGRREEEHITQAAGLEALLETYITSYFTGFIVNKIYMDKFDMLAQIEMLDDAMANYYPQGILEMWLSLKGDIIRDSTPLWLEGKVESTNWEMDKNFDYMPKYATVEERINQVVSLMNLAKSLLSLNLNYIVHFYQKVCYKYYFLVLMMKDQYIKKGDSMVEVMDKLFHALKQELFKEPFSLYKEVQNDLIDILNIIDNMHREEEIL